MYFKDLDLCRYHNGPLDSDSWHVPLRAIGWLEGGYPHSRGSMPADFVGRVSALVHDAESVFRQHHFRGLHDCTLCEPGHPDALLARSHINLLIPGRQTVYACPAAITHYLTVHEYAPPLEFVDAVLECPQYGSPRHLERLREANDGYPVPMITWDEYLIERRKVADEVIRRRRARLDAKQ